MDFTTPIGKVILTTLRFSPYYSAPASAPKHARVGASGGAFTMACSFEAMKEGRGIPV